ncbi:F-box protein [Cupriavidus nantongensis]|uniref:hypothetical protein n=1 Tax=Cupriavidus nantongensis TaxID=1796606 RepID=UPI002246973A|nr:hypothetical protein [Cupriavidus nantongensis]
MPQSCASVENGKRMSRIVQSNGSHHQSTGKLTVRGSDAAICCRSSGAMSSICGFFFGRSRAARPCPVHANPHIAALPSHVIEKIFGYLGDPFERVTAAMACRFLMRNVGRYRTEFAFFRQLIRDKKAIDFSVQRGMRREITFFLHMITDCGWTSRRAVEALKLAFGRMGALYPPIPERAFHELWPLFCMVRKEARTSLLKTLVGTAQASSPYFAIQTLYQVARRTLPVSTYPWSIYVQRQRRKCATPPMQPYPAVWSAEQKEAAGSRDIDY